MRAAFYTQQGSARDVFKIGDVPTPQAGPGEVRVKLATSGANPSDWKARSGATGRAMPWPLVVPHSDGAGVIDQVGDGVPNTRIGERVWIWNGQWMRSHGTAAEYIALPSPQAVPLAQNVSFAEAACFGIPALTALQAVRLANLRAGDHVLVTGGAGAVGHYAIQCAKMRGATVITTISNDAKAAHAKTAGADHVINYKTDNVAAKVREIAQGGVAAVIDVDAAQNAHLYATTLRPRGTAVIYGTSAADAAIPMFAAMFNSTTIRPFLIYEVTAEDRKAIVDELNTCTADGRLKHAVARTLPLAAIAEAHEVLEKGDVIGNVVIEIR